MLLAVPSFDPQATFARLSAEELREDPGDRLVALIGRHLPALLHHRGTVAVGLIILGLAKLVAADDDRWGSFIENLPVTHDRRRSGIGRALLTCVAGAVVERATGRSLYLWVLEQNTAAQRFYRAMGGTSVEKASVPPPGGVPARLNGSPSMLRFTWPDAESLLAQPGH